MKTTGAFQRFWPALAGSSLTLALAFGWVSASLARPIAITLPAIRLAAVTSGLSSPVDLTSAGDSRIFIVEQPGRIRILQNGSLLPAAFLDISGRVLSGGERGLLGLAFSPDFASSGDFYVYYTQLDGNNRLARFHASADPNLADPNSEQLILEFSHPTYANHNGGQIAFGPDGYLYVGTGDGGGGGDPFGNAQNPGALLGKLLRLDVTGAATYTIPAGNPYVNTSGYRPEIWALGLRNPWRFSFDRLTGDLYIGDVGQGLVEEIDFQPASSPGGENYGWNILEGNRCYPSGGNCALPPGYVAPVAAYEHGANDSTGCAVTGGFVYRGARWRNLQGMYLYGDYCTGRIWGLVRRAGGWETSELLQIPQQITSFGQDQAGELYVLSAGGEVFRVEGAGTYLPLVSKNR